MSRNIFARAATVVVAFAMVFGAFAAVPTAANAQTDAELAAQIQQLLATIAALQAQISGNTGTVTSAACPVGGFTFDLAIGAQGQAVVDLQRFLNAQPGIQVATAGPGAPGQESMYFGPLTRAAVIQFQQAHAAVILTPLGLAAGTGYWGPSSRARANALCTVVVVPGDDDDDADDDDDDDTRSGDEGSFTVERGSARSSSIDTGDTDDVYSIEIEADGSEIEVNRIDFMFSHRPWLYLDEVSLEVDGDEVDSMDVRQSDFSEVGNEWRLRWSGLDIDIDEDEEVEVVLMVTVLDSLAGDRDTHDIDVYVPDDGVRGTDGAGLIQYEPSGDLDSRTFGFDDTFDEGELSVTSNDDSPESGIIVVDDDDDTDNVEVLLFDVEAEGGMITIEEVYVEATTTTADADDVVSDLCLFSGSTELDCATLTLATASITNRGVATGIVAGEYYALFEDLEFEIDEDEEVTLTLEASFLEADGTNYSTGETVEFQVSQVAGENADFVDVADAVSVGAGEVFTLLTSGIFVEADDQNTPSVSEIGTTGSERGTFTIRFDVTAIEEDIFIHKNAGTSATSGVEFNIVGDSYTGTTTSNLSCSGCDTTGSTFFEVEDGTTETFTLSVTLDPASSGFYGIELESVFFDEDASLGTADTEVVVPNTSEFETDHASIAG